MKFSVAFVTAVLCAIQAAAVPQGGGPGRDCPPRERAVTLFEARLGSQDAPTDHLYSTDEQRLQRAEKRGYTRSRRAPGRVFKTAERGTKPLYRLRDPKTRQNFYTTDQGKRERAKRRGYEDRGIEAYLIESDRCRGDAFTHWSNRQTRDNFYATSDRDGDWASKHGYQNRGVEGYVYPL